MPLIALAAVAAASAAAAGLSDDPPPTHSVSRGDIVLRLDRSGRIDGADRRHVRFDVEVYNGPMRIAEVVRRSGLVGKGDVILRIEADDLERMIEDAEAAADLAARNHTYASEERDNLVEANQVRLERAEAALRAARQALEIFETFGGHRMVRQAELRVIQQEFSLENQREELAQLRAMYDDATLASETRDIVIRRAERQIEMSEEYLQFSREDLHTVRSMTFPEEKLRVENAARWAEIELNHALSQTAIAAARKHAEVANLDRAARDAKIRLDKLHRDADALRSARRGRAH